MFTQKTHLTKRSSQFPMLWNRPCYSYQLEIFREYVQWGLGKVMKFQHHSSSRFGDIPEKPEGWMKTTLPLPLIGLSSWGSFLTPDSPSLTMLNVYRLYVNVASIFLKCLTSTPIGADRAILLRLYKSIVLLIIEYGCVMYAGGTASLHKLEAVHRAGKSDQRSPYQLLIPGSRLGTANGSGKKSKYCMRSHNLADRSSITKSLHFDNPVCNISIGLKSI